MANRSSQPTGKFPSALFPMKINKPRRDETQELIVVALGPLANIALLTVQLEPEFSKNVRQIVLLGGPFTVNGKVFHVINRFYGLLQAITKLGREAIRQIFGYEIGGSHRPLRASSHIIVSQLDLITSQKFVRITKKTENGSEFRPEPSIDELTAACQMYRTWSRDDRLRLGYLAIYAGFIEAARTSSPTRASLTRLVMDLDAFEDYPWGRVAFKFLMESVKGVDLTKTYAIEGFVQVLQVWVYCCLPEFGAGFGHPIEGSPTPPLLAFLGGKGKRRLQENMLKQTRTKNFTMKDFSEMFPRWDVEIHPMKTEAGQMMRSLKTVSPSRTQSDAESRKKARESPGLDVETMKGEIVRCQTGLTSNMVEGLSRCENTLKTQSRMIEGLTTQVGAVEKMVREGWKEDHTKVGSSTDVPEANKSDGDKAKKDSAEESKGDESDESKGEESKGEESRAEESRAEESKAAETAPKGMTKRAKARDTQATV
ncbi:PREDICTED: uncharacterized protein LOC106320178, partial [Brassica oleracea var. oleracea]|uniref:uncharacterized protein LOC106320178 n=1 Tax=Brassica oleracea var. oleracea TaxID=109376 RepID=UPI0006A7231C